MPSGAITPAAYLEELPEQRRQALSQLRDTIIHNLPEGFTEVMSYGMISYVVPHSLYPSGYHCDPKQPLPFLSIASQKHYVALYHMGLYADKGLLSWFDQEYQKRFTAKLDRGKSCIRFKHSQHIPYSLIGELACKMTPQQWIDLYES